VSEQDEKAAFKTWRAYLLEVPGTSREALAFEAYQAGRADQRYEDEQLLEECQRVGFNAHEPTCPWEGPCACRTGRLEAALRFRLAESAPPTETAPA